MRRYLTHRLLLIIPTLWGAVSLVFLIMHILPGDVALFVAGAGEGGEVSEERLRQIRQELGLDRPLAIQYGAWLGRALRLDLGRSLWTGQPVLRELQQRYQVSLNLSLLALAISLLIAIPVGLLSATRRNTPLDYLLRAVAIGGISIPNFWMAILILLGLVHLFRWLPPLEWAPPWSDPWLHFKQLIFPALALGYQLSAFTARMVRSAVLEVLREDYVRTALAKGLPGHVVLLRHALRNAMLPVVTLLGIEALFLLGGVVVVETVFTLPGVGRYLLDAIHHRDYTALQGTVLAFALVVLTVNLVVDLLYSWLDPRVRYSS